MQPSSHQLSLRLLQKCPSCQALFPPAEINILEETETRLLAHLSCSNCLVNYLATISNAPQGIVGNAMVIDVSYKEMLVALEAQAMSENEFLALYKLVRDNTLISNIQ